MTRARDALSAIGLVVALMIASVALLYTNVAGEAALSVKPTAPALDAGDAILVGTSVGSLRDHAQPSGPRVPVRDVAHSATDPMVHPGSVPEALRAGRRVPSRHSAARRRARRRSRAARDHVPLLASWLLPFVMLISAGSAISVAVSRWTRASDLRLPAKRGPPSRELAHSHA
jgi:hypothetical protein